MKLWGRRNLRMLMSCCLDRSLRDKASLDGVMSVASRAIRGAIPGAPPQIVIPRYTLRSLCEFPLDSLFRGSILNSHFTCECVD